MWASIYHQDFRPQQSSPNSNPASFRPPTYAFGDAQNDFQQYTDPSGGQWGYVDIKARYSSMPEGILLQVDRPVPPLPPHDAYTSSGIFWVKTPMPFQPTDKIKVVARLYRPRSYWPGGQDAPYDYRNLGPSQNGNSFAVSIDVKSGSSDDSIKHRRVGVTLYHSPNPNPKNPLVDWPGWNQNTDKPAPAKLNSHQNPQAAWLSGSDYDLIFGVGENPPAKSFELELIVDSFDDSNPTTETYAGSLSIGDPVNGYGVVAKLTSDWPPYVADKRSAVAGTYYSLEFPADAKPFPLRRGTRFPVKKPPFNAVGVSITNDDSTSTTTASVIVQQLDVYQWTPAP